MNFNTDNDVLTLYLSGRINANNSAEKDAENPGLSTPSTLQISCTG